MLEHGGNLRRAAVDFGIPVGEWLDLSTGINPRGWPVPSLPAEVWSSLPEAEDELEAAAWAYYGVERILPVAGSQAAIQTLPRLRLPCRVGLLAASYAEHYQAWARAGHQIVPLEGQGDIERMLSLLDVLVLVQPNNPTGVLYPRERLLAWLAGLAARRGWLLVDEAFMDATPELSLLPHARPGLIVLRSLGKFFGLAGARVGFVNAQADLLCRLAEQLGPWSVSGPARRVAATALGDRVWQAQARTGLRQAGERLHGLLCQYGLRPDGGCALFQWHRTPRAAQLHQALARRGILTRRFTKPQSLRFGLPGAERDWRRLTAALEECA
ncbi:MAG: threonine-phosphate decarboxylase CobD [Candidatus Thiodiazotropha sp.]|jgi:cobalamin biosynthesis protein CobC